MAIIIPSSKTYDRQNPKVRDNVVERIEVGAVEVVPDNEYETPVYSENFLSKYDVESFITNETKNGYWGLGYKTLTYSFYKLSPFYEKNIEIKIKKLKENYFIEKIFYGFIKENTKEIPDIKATIYTKKYLGTINTRIENIKSETDYDIIYSQPTYNSVPKEGYDITSPLFEYTFTNQSGSYSETSKINFETKETIKTPTFSSDEDYYYLSFTLFVGFEEIKGGGYYEFTESFIQNWEEHKSECIKVIPQQIEITVYGNTIGIDLTDKTIYINGETAKKVHSIDGNELMQTTNTTGGIEKWVMVQGTDYSYEIVENPPIAPYSVTLPDIPIRINFLTDKAIKAKKTIYLRNGTSYFVDAGVPTYSVSGKVIVKEIHGEVGAIVPAITGLYEKTKEQYALGKETATIRCSINDYYNEKNILKISNNPINQNYDLSIIYIGGGDEKVITITLKNICNSNVIIVYTLDGQTKIGEIKIGETIFELIVDARAIFNVLSVYSCKMSFQMYDQVIPMVYGADGKDRPMSTYQDGSPKVFQVLGTKIYYDGAVWQELSLQEVDKSKVL